MHIILSDFDETSRFYPLTLSRPIAELRFGITTLKEKWVDSLKEDYYLFVFRYLFKQGYNKILEKLNISDYLRLMMSR